MVKIKNIALLNGNEFSNVLATNTVIVEIPECLESSSKQGTCLDAQYIKPEERNGEYIFPVKFVFGEAKINNSLATAVYNTTIEVLNLSEHKVKFRTRISVSTLDRELVSRSSKQSLKHYQSIEYDSEEFRFRLRRFPEVYSAKLVEGFLILKTDCCQIKVVAVYTVFRQTYNLETQSEPTVENFDRRVVRSLF